MTTPVPLATFLAALGCSTMRLAKAGDERQLAAFIAAAVHAPESQPAALSLVAATFSSKSDAPAAALNAMLLPHLGADTQVKIYLIERWSRMLLECAFGVREATDRDHLADKRVRIVGGHMEELFSAGLGRFWHDLQQALRKYGYSPLTF
jgi:DNA-directed RNA polymerase beta subunit